MWLDDSYAFTLGTALAGVGYIAAGLVGLVTAIFPAVRVRYTGNITIFGRRPCESTVQLHLALPVILIPLALRVLLPAKCCPDQNKPLEFQVVLEKIPPDQQRAGTFLNNTPIKRRAGHLCH
jgi:hypothetical protein